MSGRAATDRVLRGRFGISVNDPGHPTPPGWVRTPLTDIADLGTGHTPSRNHPEYWDGDVPWIGIRDAGAHHGGIIDKTVQTITPFGLQNSAARLLPKDTVCLSRTASVGYVVKMGRDMATSQDFVTWTCSEVLDPDFLMSALLAEGEDIRKFGEGSTHTTIYFPAVKAFHLDLPPIAEQRRIVAKLDALTARIARARAKLDRVHALSVELRHSGLAASFDSNEDIRHPLSDLIIDIRYGTAKKCDYDGGAIPVLRIPNIQKGVIDLSDLKRADFTEAEQTKLELQIGDVLVIRSNGSIDIVGRTAIVGSSAEGMLFAGYLIRIRLDQNRIRPAYLNYCMAAPKTRSLIEKAAHSSSGVNNVNAQQLQSLRIPLPSLTEQDETIRKLNSTFARADRLEAEAARARKLLDRLESAILAKAFRGELVPRDDNDEPAEKLLERIRAERAAAPKQKRGRKQASS